MPLFRSRVLVFLLSLLDIGKSVLKVYRRISKNLNIMEEFVFPHNLFKKYFKYFEKLDF